MRTRKRRKGERHIEENFYKEYEKGRKIQARYRTDGEKVYALW